MADAVVLRGLQRWRQLILPGIFSAWVTGVVTASGGAWNANIVAEVVSWGGGNDTPGRGSLGLTPVAAMEGVAWT